MPYEHHPSAGNLPDDSTVIWRFVSLAKYLSLLSSASLHFSQAMILRQKDPFEGSLARPNRLFHELMVSNQKFARDIMKMSPDQELPPNLLQIFSPETAALHQRIWAATTYVNCWHISPEESAFLWNSYSSEKDGIAMQSTVGALRSALEVDSRAVYIGEIKYIDYSCDVIPVGNVFNAFYYKRKSFAPERELRCCFSHLLEGVGIGSEAISRNPTGISVKCDIEKLIRKVFVSPYAEPWFDDVVAAVNDRFGVKAVLQRSSLMDDPIL